MDLVAKTKGDLKAGSSLQFDCAKSGNLFEYLIVPTSHIDNGNPILLYMAVGNRVKADVPAGSILTCGMIEASENSSLWELRRQQDRTFEMER